METGLAAAAAAAAVVTVVMLWCLQEDPGG